MGCEEVKVVFTVRPLENCSQHLCGMLLSSSEKTPARVPETPCSTTAPARTRQGTPARPRARPCSAPSSLSRRPGGGDAGGSHQLDRTWHVGESMYGATNPRQRGPPGTSGFVLDRSHVVSFDLTNKLVERLGHV